MVYLRERWAVAPLAAVARAWRAARTFVSFLQLGLHVKTLDRTLLCDCRALRSWCAQEMLMP